MSISLSTDPLFSLQSPSSASDCGGFIDRQRKGEAHADVFQKNEKKNETSSVYRLDVNGRRTLRSVLAISFQRP